MKYALDLRGLPHSQQLLVLLVLLAYGGHARHRVN